MKALKEKKRGFENGRWRRSKTMKKRRAGTEKKKE